MQTLCANESYLRTYLRDQDEAERRERWIEKEAAHLLRDMQPWSAHSIDEALGETMAIPKRGTDAHQAQREAILRAFAGTDDAELGKAIRAAVSAYWLAYCTSEAADDYDNGAAEYQREE